MKNLPIIDSRQPRGRSRLRAWIMHGYRVGLFVVIILAIHQQHQWIVAQQRSGTVEPVSIEQVQTLFADARSLGQWDPNHGGQTVLDQSGKRLGFIVQTFPDAQDVIGFSGPTNTMLGFGLDRRINGVAVIRSGDTKEHLRDVINDQAFMSAFNGLTWEAASRVRPDAVSGATLTSMSILDGIALRLGAENPSSRFPNKIAIQDVTPFVSDAVRLVQDDAKPSLRRIFDRNGDLLAIVARTSPHADGMIGYQGPTETMVVMDPDQIITAISIRDSFDNQPYVRYVKEDEYFLNTFRGFSLQDLASLDVVDAGIEGVSGATKTSVTVAEGLIHTAKEIEREEPLPELDVSSSVINVSARDLGTMAMVAVALLIALTHLRGIRWLRIGFQVLLVVYLGFINADMLSQALLVGWARNGIAWQSAPGLVSLSIASLACPIFSGRQVYCTHLCPFGAIQESLRRVPIRVKLSRRWNRIARRVPAMLLMLVVAVAMLHLPISLVDIEPFDAFVIRIAGWVTILVAVTGLFFSALIPMAYCHFGCPTGAMLRYLRKHGASERLTSSDFLATGLALFSIIVWLV